jgi:hypothetical protein
MPWLDKSHVRDASSALTIVSSMRMHLLLPVVSRISSISCSQLVILSVVMVSLCLCSHNMIKHSDLVQKFCILSTEGEGRVTHEFTHWTITGDILRTCSDLEVWVFLLPILLKRRPCADLLTLRPLRKFGVVNSRGTSVISFGI